MATSSTVIYLGLIPFDWDENVVKSVACGSGKLVDVRLGFDFVGKNKGYCFLEYLNPEEAQRAKVLLSQVSFSNNPGLGGPPSHKRLRIELSKEIRPHTDRLILELNRNYLPPYVIQPQEMYQNQPSMGPVGTMYQPPTQQHTLLSQMQKPPGNPNLPRVPNSLPQNPNRPQNIGYLAPLPPQPPQLQFQAPPQAQQFQAPQQYNSYNTPTPPPVTLPGAPAGPAGQSYSQMPVSLTQASKSLPQPAKLPFSVDDKINETLSKISPAQLIELIANLKNILASPQASRAGDVFQLSPDLASSAAQALLLMGLIDEEVISEAMKVTPPPQQPQHPQQQQQQHHQPPPQPYQAQNTNQFHQQQFTGNTPQYGTPPPPPPAKWSHLPPHTAAKLSAMAPDQAELVAQVLSLPQDQISSLPPDKQTMVTNIRSQYL